jgi:hypothetical protein
VAAQNHALTLSETSAVTRPGVSPAKTSR